MRILAVEIICTYEPPTELGTEQPVHKVKPVGDSLRVSSVPVLSTSFEVNIASKMEVFGAEFPLELLRLP